MNRLARRAGFTLLEALASLVLATMLFAGLALFTGSWSRQWQGLVSRGGEEDTIAVVLDRMVEDLEAAQPIYSQDGSAAEVRFEGGPESVTFLRPALGYNARAGLDETTYSMGVIGRNRAIIRSRRDFGVPDAGRGEELPLVRGALTLSLSYAGTDGVLSPQWSDPRRLPAIVRVEISASAPRPWKQWAYALLRVELPAQCGAKDALAQCKQRYGPGS